MRTLKLTEETRNNLLEELLKRSPNQYGQYEAVVNEIIQDVREKRDEAVLEYTARFDKWDCNNANLRVTKEEIQEAYSQIDDEFIACIQNEDIKRLKKLEGIGPKAASQIILDLKGSLSDFGVVSSKTTKKSLNKAQEEALLALKTLGFKVKEIEESFERINDDSLSTEEYVTAVLRMMRR